MGMLCSWRELPGRREEGKMREEGEPRSWQENVHVNWVKWSGEEPGERASQWEGVNRVPAAGWEPAIGMVGSERREKGSCLRKTWAEGVGKRENTRRPICSEGQTTEPQELESRYLSTSFSTIRFGAEWEQWGDEEERMRPRDKTLEQWERIMGNSLPSRFIRSLNSLHSSPSRISF